MVASDHAWSGAAHAALPSTPPHTIRAMLSSRSSPNPGGSSALSGAGLRSGSHGRWLRRLRRQMACWRQVSGQGLHVSALG